MLHISKHYLGDTAEFIPLIPICQNISEINMPARICAAPTVFNCWDSIKGCTDIISKMQNNNCRGYYFFIYKFSNENAFVENNEVFDFERTCEHIATTNQEATLVDVFYMRSHLLREDIKYAEPASFEEAISAYHQYQKDEVNRMQDEVNRMDWA